MNIQNTKKETLKLRAILSAILLVFAFSFSASAAEQVFYYHTDPAGTPLAMTNSSGAVVWKADYKPFGEENSITGAGVTTGVLSARRKTRRRDFRILGRAMRMLRQVGLLLLIRWWR